MDTIVLSEILGAAIGDDTLRRLEDANTSIRDYEKVRLYVKNRHTKITSCAAGKAIPKDSDKTVYGVDAAHSPSQPPPSACPGGCGGCTVHTLPPGLADAPAAGFDPSADSQDPWTYPPCAPASLQEWQWHLDLFGKGKNKGEPRPPMACYSCLGLGHPARMCPSPYGAGQSKAGLK